MNRDKSLIDWIASDSKLADVRAARRRSGRASLAMVGLEHANDLDSTNEEQCVCCDQNEDAHDEPPVNDFAAKRGGTPWMRRAEQLAPCHIVIQE